MNDWSDERLLADRRQPAESFSILYRRHVEAVLRFVASRRVDADTAADVVAETFVAALRARHRYRAQNDTALPWLLGIASRELAQAGRKSARERERGRRLAHEPIALSASDREAFQAHASSEPGDLSVLLADLPPAQQAAVRARVIDELEYDEVADRLQSTEPAARKNVSRGLATLRATLERNR